MVCRCTGSREKLEKYKTKLLQLLALSYTPPAPPPPPPPPPTDSLEVNIVHLLIAILSCTLVKFFVND